MTIERRIVVGLEDVKAITFECLKCSARLTYPANNLRDMPFKCEACGETWIPSPRDTADQPLSSFLGFLSAFQKLRNQSVEKKNTVRILLEYEAP